MGQVDGASVGLQSGVDHRPQLILAELEPPTHGAYDAELEKARMGGYSAEESLRGGRSS